MFARAALSYQTVFSTETNGFLSAGEQCSPLHLFHLNVYILSKTMVLSHCTVGFGLDQTAGDESNVWNSTRGSVKTDPYRTFYKVLLS